MQFTAEQYYRASLERMEQARRIYHEGKSYSLAMYCGGLAVESLLRAFRWKIATSFEGRHDLKELLKASEILKKVDEDFLRRKRAAKKAHPESAPILRAAMNEVIILWHNNLRFASEASLEAFLKDIKRLKGAGKDPLKKNALDLINASQVVINQGVVLWTSKKKS